MNKAILGLGGVGFFGLAGIYVVDKAFEAMDYMTTSAVKRLSRISKYETARVVPTMNTKQALTERQRGLDIIRQSRMNARNMFGTEANLMHR